MDNINSTIESSCEARKLTEHQAAIILRMTSRVGELLVKHFKSIESVRDANTTATANVNIAFILGYDNGAGYTKTKIRFMRSYQDEAEDTIGDPNQRDWIEDTKQDVIPAAPKAPSDEPKKPAKKAKK